MGILQKKKQNDLKHITINMSKRNLKIPKGRIKTGLRLEYYFHSPCCNGGSASGYADQYGRLMEIYINDKKIVDYKPSGLSIFVNH